MNNVVDWAFAYFPIYKKRLLGMRKVKKNITYYSTSKHDLDPKNTLMKRMKRPSLFQELTLKIGYVQGW